MSSTRNPTGSSPAPAPAPRAPRFLPALLALLVLLSGFSLPLTEHGHGLDETHQHTCSACRLADAGVAAEAPQFTSLGLPEPEPIDSPRPTPVTPASRLAPDPLRPRAPPAA